MANHGGRTIIMGTGGNPPTSTKRQDEFARDTADEVTLRSIDTLTQR